MSLLEIEGLSRTFGRGSNRVEAVRDVTLDVDEGETVGLLGVNGAGKTTLLKVISTLLLPTSGKVRIAGVDVVERTREARRLFSVVLGGDRGFYNRLSGRENARYFGILSGLGRREAAEKADAALASMGLEEAADRAVETYSKGMRQRLHLAAGLMTKPRLLLLDEPTAGLDPIEAERLRSLIGELTREGVTLLLTSHYLGDIERLTRRVVIIQRGRITHDEGLKRLLEQASAAAKVTVTGAGPAPGEVLAELAAGVRVVDRTEGGGRWSVAFEVPDWSPESLRALADLWPDRAVADVRVEPASLEGVFSRSVATPVSSPEGG
jgi:ABC-2 type transport system ATP-binding protein